MGNAKKGSILAAVFWMFLISLLLFWLPVAGPPVTITLPLSAALPVAAGMEFTFV